MPNLFSAPKPQNQQAPEQEQEQAPAPPVQETAPAAPGQEPAPEHIGTTEEKFGVVDPNTLPPELRGDQPQGK